MPRFKPYTAAGIRRVPCARCGEPSYASWTICADKIGNRHQHRALCTDCDIDLNTMVMRWAFGSDREDDITAYAEKVRAES